MKNKLKFLLLIIIGIFAGSVTNVHAETSLPANYEVGNFKYTIEGVDIIIYKEEGIFTNTVYKEINVPKESITINPVGRTINTPKTMPSMTGVKLNLSLSEDSIEQLVKKEIPIISNKDEFYAIFTVVNYKLTETPREYPYMFRLNYFNIFSGMFDEMVGDNSDLKFNVEDTKLSINQSTSQIIDIAAYGMKDGQVLYVTESEEESSKEAAIMDYVLLSKEENLNLTETSTDNTYGFIIHDLDNIEEVLAKNENYYEESDNTYNDNNNQANTETKQIQKVAVPNTAANNTSKTLFGISIMLLGSSIILFELRKKFKN